MTVAGEQRQPTTAQPRPRVSERELESGRSLREAINRLARPGVVPEPGDRLEMNRWGAYPPLAPQLTAQGELVWVSERPVVAAFAAIARDGIDLLTGPLAGRTRECAAPDCALLFVDSSRPGRRRCVRGRRLATALVVGAPREPANTLQMTPEDLDRLYPDGPKVLPPELQAERQDRAT